MKPYINTPILKDETAAISLLQEKSHSLTDSGSLQPLLDRIGDARIVMLGEASHGTHEYYSWRAAISKRLIAEKGFNFIAVEGDWPDCYRVNRYIKNYADAGDTAFDVLRSFKRWPTWMWANWEMVSFSEWLLEHNHPLPKNSKVGFYGLDVYSLWESMEAISDYLKRVDPASVKIVQQALNCFEPYRKGEGQEYARACMFVPELCQPEVAQLLTQIRKRLPQYNTDHENVFSAEQNALIAVNAEKYYNAMLLGGPHTWNIRDEHMADTLERLLQFHGENAKAIVWAHNTHIGDARATDMSEEGMVNIGELSRLKHQERGVVLVGFGSYQGSVIAGMHWGARLQAMNVPDAKKGSWEYLLHRAGEGNKLYLTKDLLDDLFMENNIGHRAIGVVYNPEYESYGNYVPTVIPLRYDAFVFIDQTHALYPLHVLPHAKEVPETYPFGV
ncbi:MAG: erythromycin esterase family protein [Bacteroidetes bacterium]|nr:erythromycin esterase family protein [Bacteroidota bacterium]